MKKGFTLVELAAVVIILGVIGLVALSSISNRIKSNKEALYQSQLTVLKQAAQNWSISNPSNLPDENVQRVVVTLGTLKQDGFMDEEFVNPLTDENFSNTFQVVITYINGNYRYEVNDSTVNSKTEIIDNKVPVLTAKSGDVTIIKGTNVNTSEYFNTPEFGVTGGSMSCNPSNTSSLEAGTHEITCTATGKNGKKTTATKTIVVDYEQIVNYTMLYDNGNECTSITGGWERYGYNSGVFQKNSDHIYVTGVGYNKNTNSFGTVNLINKSDHSQLYYVISLGNEYYESAGLLYYTWWSAFVASGKFDGNYDNSTYGIAGAYSLTNIGDKENNLRYHSSPWKNQKKWLFVDLSTVNIPFYPAFSYTNWGVNDAFDIYLYSSFMTKADDYVTLASLSQLSNISSINDILASSANCSSLLSNEAAVRFMIKQCTGDFMVSAINSETFLTALESSPYKDLVYSNAHWNKFLNMAK